jgi:hypothetical protein
VEKHNGRSNQQALGSSVGQFFEVLKESSVWFFNISESKSRQFQFFEKYSESKNCPLQLFQKNLKEWMVFMKEPAKN